MPAPRIFSAEGIVALGLEKLPWSKAALQFRQRVSSCARAEGEEWPDLSDEGLARNAAGWLMPLLLDKTARRQIAADELSNAVMNTAALAAAPPARRRGADPFHRADRLERADRLRSRAGTDRIDPRAGAVRTCRASGDRPRPRTACDRAVVSRSSAGASDARSAGLLARQLCRCEDRNARTLSQAPLAGRSAIGRPPRAAPSRAAKSACGRLSRPFGAGMTRTIALPPGGLPFKN